MKLKPNPQTFPEEMGNFKYIPHGPGKMRCSSKKMDDQKLRKMRIRCRKINDEAYIVIYIL